MEIYLPIVQVHIDVIFILFISFAVGVLSGLFGVGGGFLMTPFLIFLGIPPVYAVPNEINNILATSVSGSMTHWFKNTLDYKMGMMIIIGGVLGTILGIITFSTWQLNAKDDDDPETDRRKRATREAILGLIIAILAYLDLKAAPFFIIWIVSYYLDK